jgi:hypothetical protein
MSPSERLTDAHLALAEAARALASASTAADAAREYDATVALELAERTRRDEALTASRAKSLAKALRSGASPKLKTSPT